MNKRLLTNLILLFLVLTLSGYFILSDQPAGREKIILLSDIDTDRINKITIENNGADNIVFIRQQQNWYMTAPILAAAELSRIKSILYLPASRSFTQIEKEDAMLTSFQLDPPLLVLSLDEYKFFFGTSEPINERRYLMFDETIHLLIDNLFPQLSQPWPFFVSRRLVPEQEKIVSIQFKQQLITRTDNDWLLDPANDLVDKKQLNDLVDSWENAEALHISRSNNIEPAEKVILKFKSGNSINYEIIAKSPQLILRRDDLSLQYRLEINLGKKMFIAH